MQSHTNNANKAWQLCSFCLCGLRIVMWQRLFLPETNWKFYDPRIISSWKLQPNCPGICVKNSWSTIKAGVKGYYSFRIKNCNICSYIHIVKFRVLRLPDAQNTKQFDKQNSSVSCLVRWISSYIHCKRKDCGH